MNFEAIYTAYWEKVFRLCLGYINDYNAAEDMAQETFITVWKELPNFRNEAAIGTWIYRIVTNTCLRQLQKDKRVKKVALPLQFKEEVSVDIEPQIQLLYKFISELPELDRIIISLELEDVRQLEIAQIVGLSEGNVRIRIYRIKKDLAKKFKEYEN